MIHIKILNCSGYEVYNKSVQHAEGCFVYDENNNKYADFESGVWALSLGHNNKRINNKLIAQVQAISHTGYRYLHPVVETTADKLLQLMKFENGKCLFLSSGSEAVEFCMKLVKKMTDKPKFLSLNNHYLSAYGISGSYTDPENWISLDWQAKIDQLDMDFSILDEISFDQIGAFVFEPGNASGVVKIPPVILIQKVVEKIKENNGWIITDEVTTGFGRTGKWFGFEHYGIVPDLIACGKGIGNGYPVSVVGMNERTCRLIENIDFTYAQSHQNDPLGCAVISEVISVIEDEKLLIKAEGNGEYLKNGLTSLSEKYPFIKEVRGVGLMCAIELKNSVSNEILFKLHRDLYNLGYMIGLKPASKTLRFYPPLIVEKELIDSLLSALDEVLYKM